MRNLCPTRRSVLAGACVAAFTAAAPASASAGSLVPNAASVSPDGLAPRATCAHEGCRFWRPGGLCGLKPGPTSSAVDRPGLTAAAE